MAHRAKCKISSTGELDTMCEQCSRMLVDDLDERSFALLMGCSRSELEQLCRTMYPNESINVTRLGSGDGVKLPTKLYNFWDTIMHQRAVQVQYRRKQLETSLKFAGEV